MTSAKEKIEGSKEDFDKDIQEIRETAKNREYDLTRKVKYIAKKEKNKLIIIGVLAVFAVLAVTDQFAVEVPEWIYLTLVSSIVGGIVAYLPAQKLVNWLITDTRVPLLELPDDGFDMYKVPRERVSDIELTDGNLHETETAHSATRAYELRKFERIEEKGESHLIGLGTWESTFPNSDIKRMWENVKAMRENLVPQAKKAKQYDIRMPYWIHQIENQTINDIVYQFEEGATFSGQDMHKAIKEDMDIDDGLTPNEEKQETMKIEQLTEDMEEMRKMMNGDNNA